MPTQPYFRLIEKSNFSPLDSLESIFVSPNRLKPHLLLLKDDRLNIIGLETGLEISTWRLPEAYARQIQISTDFVFLGILKSSKEMVSTTIYVGNTDFISAKPYFQTEQG